MVDNVRLGWLPVLTRLVRGVTKLAHYVAYLSDLVLEGCDVSLLLGTHRSLAVAVVIQNTADLAPSWVLQTFSRL